MDSQYLEAIVKPLVSFPEDVRVERTQDDRGVLLTLHLNPQDMGKIIGKAGETAKAIRYLVRFLGITQKSHISVVIHEPNGNKRVPSYERRPYDREAQQDEFSL